MRISCPVGVTSRSFSSHPTLRSELQERYSDVRFNEAGVSLQGEPLIEFARGCRKLIVALERVDDALLDALPELEVVSKYGVGTDTVDRSAMARRGVRLGWTGGVNRRSVAELTLAMIISLLRHVPALNEELRSGAWRNRRGRQLSGRTVGIVGCGHIGKDLAGLLGAFGCKLLAHDIRDFPEFYGEHGVEPVGLDELLERSDIVTLHLPLDGSTRNLMNRDRLSRMKRDALLINTARGGLVDEDALITLLGEGALAGAAFDVFATEPSLDSPLLRLPNFLATPHIGGSSDEAVLAMGRAAIRGLDVNRIPTDEPAPGRPRALPMQPARSP